MKKIRRWSRFKLAYPAIDATKICADTLLPFPCVPMKSPWLALQTIQDPLLIGNISYYVFVRVICALWMLRVWTILFSIWSQYVVHFHTVSTVYVNGYHVSRRYKKQMDTLRLANLRSKERIIAPLASTNRTVHLNLPSNQFWGGPLISTARLLFYNKSKQLTYSLFSRPQEVLALYLPRAMFTLIKRSIDAEQALPEQTFFRSYTFTGL